MSKLISFLGDSITAGAGASKVENTYVSRIESILGVRVQNLGVGGSRLAKQDESGNENPIENFTDRAERIDPTADLVVVFGGTNDFGHGLAKFGDKDSHDVYTFNGAINYLCEMLLAKFPKEKILFILPAHRYDEDNVRGEGYKPGVWPTLKEYVHELVEGLNRYGIEYYEIKTFPAHVPCFAGEEKTRDGLHPNDEGHLSIALELAELLKKKGF